MSTFLMGLLLVAKVIGVIILGIFAFFVLWKDCA